MKCTLKRLVSGIAIFGVSVLILGAVCYVAGIHVNTTRSLPRGIYWTSSAPIEKGSYVIFCPPEADAFDVARQRNYIGSGFCSGRYGPIMKMVLAAKGDAITVTDDGMMVNGRLLPHSKPRRADPAGRVLPRYQADNYRLNDSELLMMSNVNDLSFDGRYFGPINRSQVMRVIRPIIIW